MLYSDIDRFLSFQANWGPGLFPKCRVPESRKIPITLLPAKSGGIEQTCGEGRAK